MRTTNEIIEAARTGEQCTDEELRLCIVSMRSVAILTHSLNAKIATDESVKPLLKSKALNCWESINKGWNIPVDQRVGSDNHPSNPDVRHRRDFANKVMKAAVKRANN